MQRKPRLTLSSVPQQNTTAWSHTGEILYSKILRLWHILLLSCAADCILFSQHIHALSTTSALFCSLVTAGVLFPLLSQSRLHRFLHLLRASQAKQLKEEKKIIIGSAIAMVFFATSAKLFLAVKLPIIPALILIGILLIITMRSSKKFIEEIRIERERFRVNPLSQIERWEEQVVALSLMPMLLARGIGIFGALQNAESGATFGIAAPFTLLSFMFLAMLKPKPQMFKGFCPRCKQPVPLVVVSLGSCSRCDATLKQKD